MMKSFHDSQNMNKMSVLLCTDIAARGLDIEEVDWVLQYDIPNDSDCYLHRVGRTSRGTSSKEGNALLFVNPYEGPFLKHIKQNQIGNWTGF